MLKVWSSSHAFRIAITAAAGALLLAGCTNVDEPTDAGSSPTRSASPSATPAATAPLASASPTPTPSPTPPIDLEDPSTWVIDFTSFGPLSRGIPLGDAATSMTAFTPTPNEGCPWMTTYSKVGSPTILLVALPDSDLITQVVLRESEPGAAPTASSPRTRDGIALGSTLAELTTVYPTVQEIEGPPGEPSYSVTDDAGNYLNFGVNEQDIVHAILLRDQPGVPHEYCS
jgi:hypothetical protein